MENNTQPRIYNNNSTIITSEDRKKYVSFFDFKPMNRVELNNLINQSNNNYITLSSFLK